MRANPFDTRPKTSKLNVLPQNPEKAEEESVVGPGRFPSWLHRKLPEGGALWQTQKVLHEKRLPTVCEEARCPNLLECWTKKTATFLVLGKECTRNCGFCSIDFSKEPSAPDPLEPEKIAESVELLGLRHVVITMVARDDLEDQGAEHLAACVRAIRARTPSATLELLTSDFSGQQSPLDVILSVEPEVFNHNIETVRRLTPRVRHKATYDRTLALLERAKSRGKKGLLIKSGLMVGLGETTEEVFETLDDLHRVGVDIVTIGQYLQADPKKLRVKAFIEPKEFKRFEEYGKSLGIRDVFSGPFVRSSYSAAEFVK